MTDGPSEDRREAALGRLLLQHQAIEEASPPRPSATTPLALSVGKDVARAQVRDEHALDDGFLGLAFTDHEQSDHGRPPSTFLSYSSDSE